MVEHSPKILAGEEEATNTNWDFQADLRNTCGAVGTTSLRHGVKQGSILRSKTCASFFLEWCWLRQLPVLDVTVTHGLHCPSPLSCQ